MSLKKQIYHGLWHTSSTLTLRGYKIITGEIKKAVIFINITSFVCWKIVGNICDFFLSTHFNNICFVILVHLYADMFEIVPLNYDRDMVPEF